MYCLVTGSSSSKTIPASIGITSTQIDVGPSTLTAISTRGLGIRSGWVCLAAAATTAHLVIPPVPYPAVATRASEVVDQLRQPVEGSSNLCFGGPTLTCV